MMASMGSRKLTQARTLTKRQREILLDQAQEIIYDAWEAVQPKRRIVLAHKALEVSPDCADAYVILAQAAAEPADELELYRKGVQAGERALGKKTFESEEGNFWGILETRPYMRARGGLAQCLWESGQHDEALAHYRALLKLNPNDNQGNRYLLASCLIKLRYHEELAALLKQYDEDISANWSWTRALMAFREHGDVDESRNLLTTALETNSHVPDYLLDRKKLPRRLPDYVGFGDETEAVSYAAEDLEAWKATVGALAWLADRVGVKRPLLLN
jgi:tetratricopeptide (TPR) repeat protein